jgi:hypothetical protein
MVRGRWLIDGGFMSRVSSQKQKLIGTIGSALSTFDQLTAASAGRAKEHLHRLFGQWVREGLTAARTSIEAIDVQKVLELRQINQTTHAVFQSHIDTATSALQGKPSGVICSIAELFKHTVDFSAHEIRQLGRVLQLSKAARRQAKILRSRSLSFVTSGGFWVLIAAASVLAVPVYRYGSAYWRAHEASASTVGAVVSTQVRKDVEFVRSQATAPDKPLIERSASTAKAVWDLVDTVPKIFNALVGAWGILLLWLRR